MCYFDMMNCSSECCQTRAQHFSVCVRVCVCVRVSHPITQVWKYTEPCSQAILTGRVGVCQDTSPQGKGMRGSRDDGG